MQNSVEKIFLWLLVRRKFIVESWKVESWKVESFPRIFLASGFAYLAECVHVDLFAVGFGQFILEGAIDKELKELIKIALQREMSQILIDRWGDYKEIRVKFLNKMISDVDKIEIKQ